MVARSFGDSHPPAVQAHEPARAKEPEEAGHPSLARGREKSAGSPTSTRPPWDLRVPFGARCSTAKNESGACAMLGASAAVGAAHDDGTTEPPKLPGGLHDGAVRANQAAFAASADIVVVEVLRTQMCWSLLAHKRWTGAQAVAVTKKDATAMPRVASEM